MTKYPRSRAAGAPRALQLWIRRRAPPRERPAPWGRPGGRRHAGRRAPRTFGDVAARPNLPPGCPDHLSDGDPPRSSSSSGAVARTFERRPTRMAPSRLRAPTAQPLSGVALERAFQSCSARSALRRREPRVLRPCAGSLPAASSGHRPGAARSAADRGLSRGIRVKDAEGRECHAIRSASPTERREPTATSRCRG